jgi:serine/threonine-protein kinase
MADYDGDNKQKTPPPEEKTSGQDHSLDKDRRDGQGINKETHKTRIMAEQQTLQSDKGEETSSKEPAPDPFSKTLQSPPSSMPETVEGIFTNTEKISYPNETGQQDGAAEIVGIQIHETNGYTRNNTILPRFQSPAGDAPLISEAERRYHIKKKIGEGGAGEVQLVVDKDINRYVALKRLKRDLHNPKMLMRFVDEIRTVGLLEHPNIVPIHDVGKDENGQYYFIMKYVDGETLQSVIEKLKSGNRHYHRLYTFQYRTQIFVEILKAVEFAHHKGIIHRDLKPANIMIGSHGEVMVMDWGIAKRAKTGVTPPTLESTSDPAIEGHFERDKQTLLDQRITATQHNVTVGTPAYMAPEQILKQHDKIDQRADIYSLCALFYEFLTLKSYLKPKSSLKEILQAAVREKPKFAMTVSNKYQVAVPADLSHFLAKGLAKDPKKRYQTVREMLDLLQKIAEGYTPVQCPFTFTKRLTNALVHLVNNHPMVGLVFFMMLLMVIAGGVYFLYQLFM